MEAVGHKLWVALCELTNEQRDLVSTSRQTRPYPNIMSPSETPSVIHVYRGTSAMFVWNRRLFGWIGRRSATITNRSDAALSWILLDYLENHVAMGDYMEPGDVQTVEFPRRWNWSNRNRRLSFFLHPVDTRTSPQLVPDTPPPKWTFLQRWPRWLTGRFCWNPAVASKNSRQNVKQMTQSGTPFL